MIMNAQQGHRTPSCPTCKRNFTHFIRAFELEADGATTDVVLAETWEQIFGRVTKDLNLVMANLRAQEAQRRRQTQLQRLKTNRAEQRQEDMLNRRMNRLNQ